jgi:hypothetical protein
MSGRRRQRPQGRGSAAVRTLKPEDMWRPVPELPEPEPITPIDDPTALLRSLGDPPLSGNALVAGHYLATVVERAAVLATALAASADLLVETEAD